VNVTGITSATVFSQELAGLEWGLHVGMTVWLLFICCAVLQDTDADNAGAC